MRIILSLIFLSSFFISCERDEELLHSPMMPPPAPDTIIYTDIPDFSLHTGSGPNLPGQTWVAQTMNDTSIIDSIDVDLDGVYDIKFILSNWYDQLSVSSPSSNYGCSISVGCIQSTDTIAFYGTHYWWIADLYLNDPVSNSLHYDYFSINSTGRFISYQFGIGPPGIHNFTGEKYLGFKMFRNNKTMFGWVRIESVGYNGVIVKDFAVNLTDGNSILCGQQN